MPVLKGKAVCLNWAILAMPYELDTIYTYRQRHVWWSGPSIEGCLENMFVHRASVMFSLATSMSAT